MTPADQRINRDEGLKLPGCWTATLKRRGGGGAGNSRPAPSGHVYPRGARLLKTTGASGRNVGKKVFSSSKVGLQRSLFCIVMAPTERRLCTST